MIRYIVKNVDNIAINGTINSRISYDRTQIIVKFEIDLDNLSSLLKSDLQSLADSMAISYTSKEAKASIVSKINEKVKTQAEMIEYTRDNTDLWNPEPGTYP
jgi:methyl-accepting chemotaxis protein